MQRFIVKVSSFCLVGIILIQSIILALPVRVNAADQVAFKGEYVDASKINVDLTGTFDDSTKTAVKLESKFQLYDQNIWDDTQNYKTKDCEETNFDASSRGSANGKFSFKVKSPYSGKCEGKNDMQVAVEKPENYQIHFGWIDAAHIDDVNGRKLTADANDPNKFIGTINEDLLSRPGSGIQDKLQGLLDTLPGYALTEGTFSCLIRLTVNSGDKSLGDAAVECTYKAKACIKIPFTDIKKCQDLKKSEYGTERKGIKITNVQNANNSGSPTADSLGGGNTDITCETSKGSALSFVMCPIINGGSNFIDWVFDSVVVPLLENVPISAQSDSEVFKVWSGFRFLANILLVMVLLVIIIGASTGGGNH